MSCPGAVRVFRDVYLQPFPPLGQSSGSVLPRTPEATSFAAVALWKVSCSSYFQDEGVGVGLSKNQSAGSCIGGQTGISAVVTALFEQGVGVGVGV
jgi:hypothetical protein